MAIAKNQNFEIMTIHRSQIMNAPYNPRYITESNEKRLRKGLQKFGLATTLTWNKRTGNLVSGHQRLKQMDLLEKTQDYELTVSAVDLTEKEEKALNVQMNNTSMMGEFDIDALIEMAEDGVDVDDMGFSESDIDILFGDSDLAKKFEDTSEVDEAKDTLREIKKDRSAYAEQMKKENNASYYFTVICESADEREELYKKWAFLFMNYTLNHQCLIV